MSALPPINSQTPQLPSHANIKAYSFQRLPQDLIGSILSSGLNWQERMNTQQTCWAARRPLFQKEAPAMPWFKTASGLIGFLESEAVPMHSKKVSDLKLSRMPEISDQDIKTVTSYLPELKSVSFHPRFNPSSFRTFTEKYPNLTALTLYEQHNKYDLTNCLKNLQHLNLSYSYLNPDELKRIIETKSCLKKLEIAHSNYLYDTHFLLSANLQKNLEYLNIEYAVSDLTDIQFCRNLRYLNVVGCYTTPSILQAIVKNLTLLETLLANEMTFNDYFPDSDFLDFSQSTKLENLALTFAGVHLLNNFLEKVRNCPLKKLSLDFRGTQPSYDESLTIIERLPPNCQITFIYKNYFPVFSRISIEEMDQLKAQGIQIILC